MGEQKHTSRCVVVNYSTDTENKSLNGYVSNMRWHNCLALLCLKSDLYSRKLHLAWPLKSVPTSNSLTYTHNMTTEA